MFSFWDSMKINNSHNQSFGSRKIFNTKVFQKVASNVQKPIDAFVAELDISDMDRFSTSEMDLKRTKLGGQIIENFIGECKEKFPQVGQNKRYIILETPVSSSENRVKGIGLLERQPEGYMWLSKLQSLSSEPKNSSIKGVGSSLMYSFIKLAKDTNQLCIALKALNEDALKFYQHLCFWLVKPATKDLILYKRNFDCALDIIEKRCPIEHIEK